MDNYGVFVDEAKVYFSQNSRARGQPDNLTAATEMCQLVIWNERRKETAGDGRTSAKKT
jgi:hypothetical protein